MLKLHGLMHYYILTNNPTSHIVTSINVTVFWKTVHLRTFHISRNTDFKY